MKLRLKPAVEVIPGDTLIFVLGCEVVQVTSCSSNPYSRENEIKFIKLSDEFMDLAAASVRKFNFDDQVLCFNAGTHEEIRAADVQPGDFLARSHFGEFDWHFITKTQTIAHYLCDRISLCGRTPDGKELEIVRKLDDVVMRIKPLTDVPSELKRIEDVQDGEVISCYRSGGVFDAGIFHRVDFRADFDHVFFTLNGDSRQNSMMGKAYVEILPQPNLVKRSRANNEGHLNIQMLLD